MLALWGWRRLALGALVVVIAASYSPASGPANFRAAIPPDAYRAARPFWRPSRRGDEYRVLSLARDDYALGEIAAQRFPYPTLPAEEINNYSIALKLNEVLSHNLPLEYHLSSVDGYDGGVLPLRRWVDLMRRLVEEDEPRIDGVVRNRLHYLPDERLLDLLNVRWVLTSSLQDAAVGGIPYDRLVTRRLAGRALRAAGRQSPPRRGAAVVRGRRRRAGRRHGGAADRGGSRRPRAALRRSRWAATRRARAPPGEGGTELPTASPPDPALRNADYATRLPLGAPSGGTTASSSRTRRPDGTWLVPRPRCCRPAGARPSRCR